MFNMPRPQQGLWLIIILLLILLGLCLGFSFWWGGPTPSTSVTSGAPATSSTPQTNAGNTANTAAPHVIEQLRDTLTSGDQGPELVLIPAGTFQMGSPDSEPGRYPNERLHTVTIEHTFAISRYEISFDEYALFAQTSGHPLPSDQDWGQKQHPVINVSWLDAMAYTDWLSTQTGQHYRLPTEAEWEYAARAGTQTAYWWGDTFKPAWLNCYGCDPNKELSTPLPVGQFPANAFGLYDVLGNVWEWTCSNYSEDYDGSETRCSEVADASNKAIRGGSYQNRPVVTARFTPQKGERHALRCAVRDYFYPDDRNDILGFRVVRTLQ